MAFVNRVHAQQIATKLQATIDKSSSAHQLAVIVIDGIQITQFGIRRSSNKELGHGHIPAAIGLTQSETRALADCTISRDGWIKKAREKGLIPPKEWVYVCAKNRRHRETIEAHEREEGRVCSSCGAPTTAG